MISQPRRQSRCATSRWRAERTPSGLREVVASVVEPERARLLGVYELALLPGYSNGWASQRVNDGSVPGPVEKLKTTPVGQESDVLNRQRGE